MVVKKLLYIFYIQDGFIKLENSKWWRTKLFYLVTPIDDVKIKSSIQHSFQFVAEKNENMQKGKVEGREREGGGEEEDSDKRRSRAPIASFSLSQFSRTHFYRILPTCSLFLLPVYSHVLTLVQCFYLFFCTRGNKEHLLRKVEEKKWLARMFVYDAIDA